MAARRPRRPWPFESSCRPEQSEGPAFDKLSHREQRQRGDHENASTGGNVLTGPVLDILPKVKGPKVIYAAANRLGGRAGREGVTFKQTPYALEV